MTIEEYYSLKSDIAEAERVRYVFKDVFTSSDSEKLKEMKKEALSFEEEYPEVLV